MVAGCAGGICAKVRATMAATCSAKASEEKKICTARVAAAEAAAASAGVGTVGAGVGCVGGICVPIFAKS